MHIACYPLSVCYFFLFFCLPLLTFSDISYIIVCMISSRSVEAAGNSVVEMRPFLVAGWDRKVGVTRSDGCLSRREF